jgi:hypothetical protein
LGSPTANGFSTYRRCKASKRSISGSRAVAKSTHAGIPWLRFIRHRLGERVHFWPFDGWDISAGRSAIVEVYPALWSRSFAWQIELETSMTPTASQRGCSMPTGMATFLRPSSSNAESSCAGGSSVLAHAPAAAETTALP